MNAPDNARGSMIEGLFGLTLSLVPQRLRSRFGAEIQETFAAERRARRASGGRRAETGYVARAIVDVVRVAAAEALRKREGRREPPRSRGRLLMESIWRDFRYALRRLRSSPGFAATAISILALGIALNTAVFSIGYSVLWRPLEVPEPDRVAVLYAATPDLGYSRFSYPDYRDFREGTDAFDNLAASEIIGVDADPKRRKPRAVRPGSDAQLLRDVRCERGAGSHVRRRGRDRWRGGGGGRSEPARLATVFRGRPRRRRSASHPQRPRLHRHRDHARAVSRAPTTIGSPRRSGCRCGLWRPSSPSGSHKRRKETEPTSISSAGCAAM